MYDLMTSSLHSYKCVNLYGHNSQELVTSLERSRESLATDLASTSAQVQSLQEELKSLPVMKDNLQVCNYLIVNVDTGDWGSLSSYIYTHSVC